MTDLDMFIRGYISCLYFVDTGDEDQPDSDLELSEQATDHITQVCTEFWNEFGQVVLEAECYAIAVLCFSTYSYDHTIPDRAGFDFYLTRAGHGAGFWDGDWSEPHATILTNGSGVADDYLYEDEDGYISIG